MIRHMLCRVRPAAAATAWRTSLRALGPQLPRRAFTTTSLEDQEDLPIPQELVKKMPRRRWMSVQDLVTEVEQALVQGERLDKDAPAYENLRREAVSLRLENDELTEKVAELEEARAEYVAQEEQFTAKLNANGGFFAHEEEVVNMTGKIREVDYKIAGLRHKHYHNIKDVGSLKRTMSLIEKRGEVTTVIDKVNDALERGEVLDEEGPEARSLADLVQRLRKESEKVWPKISSYERDIGKFSEKLSETQSQLLAIRDTPTRDSDDLRTHLKAQINQVKRMMAQLGRLRDIQRVNAQEIGMVERVRAKLFKQVRVRNLLAEGNPENMAMKIATLQEDTDRLRTTIKDLEAGLQPLTKEAADIIGKLREMPFEFTTETGKLREQLIANIHHESHWKERLAVLRGEKLQNIRFIALLKKALSQKSS